MKFNIKGFQLSITYSSLALITFIVISNFSTGYILCFLAVLTHELGHITAMLLCKNKPDGLKISAFDIKIINSKRCTQNTSNDIIVTSFGVVFNIINFLLFCGFNRQYAFVNLFVGIFNLLPASTLDGGQLLFLLLSRKFTAETSSKVVDIVTLIILFPLFVLGIMILFYSKYNFSLLFISVYLILSLFLKKDKIL